MLAHRVFRAFVVISVPKVIRDVKDLREMLDLRDLLVQLDLLVLQVRREISVRRGPEVFQVRLVQLVRPVLWGLRG